MWFDILKEVLEFYVKHQFLTDDEALKCIRQWPVFHSRVLKLRTEGIYEVYVDILKENDDDIDSNLTFDINGDNL